MNILAASSSARHRADIIGALPDHAIKFVDDAATAFGLILQPGAQALPALLILHCVTEHSAAFVELEQITNLYPQLSIVLLSSSPTADVLLGAMRAGVREVIPMPLIAGALEAAVERLASKQPGGQVMSTGKILAFIGCKGGVGATFLATNLACQLGESSTVLIIDLNLQFGDALSFAHDGKPTATLADVARDIGRLDASLLASSSVRIAPGCSILAAPEHPDEAIDITPAHIDAILAIAVKQYDFVVLDLGRALNPISIKALDRAHKIYPVLEAGLGAIRNAGKLQAAFTALGYAGTKIEVILNRHESRAEITPDDIKRVLGLTTLRTISNSYRDVAKSIRHGDPLVRTARTNAVVKNVTDLMRSLLPAPLEQRGIVNRLLRRA